MLFILISSVSIGWCAVLRSSSSKLGRVNLDSSIANATNLVTQMGLSLKISAFLELKTFLYRTFLNRDGVAHWLERPLRSR